MRRFDGNGYVPVEENNSSTALGAKSYFLFLLISFGSFFLCHRVWVVDRKSTDQTRIFNSLLNQNRIFTDTLNKYDASSKSADLRYSENSLNLKNHISALENKLDDQKKYFHETLSELSSNFSTFHESMNVRTPHLISRFEKMEATFNSSDAANRLNMRTIQKNFYHLNRAQILSNASLHDVKIRHASFAKFSAGLSNMLLSEVNFREGVQVMSFYDFWNAASNIVSVMSQIRHYFKAAKDYEHFLMSNKGSQIPTMAPTQAPTVALKNRPPSYLSYVSIPTDY